MLFAILDTYGIKADGDFDLVASTLVVAVVMKCIRYVPFCGQRLDCRKD